MYAPAHSGLVMLLHDFQLVQAPRPLQSTLEYSVMIKPVT